MPSARSTARSSLARGEPGGRVTMTSRWTRASCCGPGLGASPLAPAPAEPLSSLSKTWWWQMVRGSSTTPWLHTPWFFPSLWFIRRICASLNGAPAHQPWCMGAPSDGASMQLWCCACAPSGRGDKRLSLARPGPRDSVLRKPRDSRRERERWTVLGWTPSSSARRRRLGQQALDLRLAKSMRVPKTTLSRGRSSEASRTAAGTLAHLRGEAFRGLGCWAWPASPTCATMFLGTCSPPFCWRPGQAVGLGRRVSS